MSLRARAKFEETVSGVEHALQLHNRFNDLIQSLSI